MKYLPFILLIACNSHTHKIDKQKSIEEKYSTLKAEVVNACKQKVNACASDFKQNSIDTGICEQNTRKMKIVASCLQHNECLEYYNCLIPKLSETGNSSIENKAMAGPEKSFSWNVDSCSFTGFYDSAKFNEKQVENTAKLQFFSVHLLEVDSTVFKYEEIEKLDLSVLEREYHRTLNELKKLEIVPNAAWEKIRSEMIGELTKIYQLKKTAIQAYKDPTVLLLYQGTQTCRKKYAEGIAAGGEKLIQTWQIVNESLRANNADPAFVKRQFEKRNASADRLHYALVETMSFGWWNCEIGALQVQSQDKARMEFRKLFLRVEEACEEGDI